MSAIPLRFAYFPMNYFFLPVQTALPLLPSCDGMPFIENVRKGYAT